MNKLKLWSALGLSIPSNDNEQIETIDLRDMDVFSVNIKDKYLHKVINENLGYGYDVKHQPSIHELRSLVRLDIHDYDQEENYLYLKDVSILEYLSNVTHVSVNKTFVEEDFFRIIGSLPKLKSFTFHNSYMIGTELSLKHSNILVNGVCVNRVYINPCLDLGLLSKSQSLEFIDIKKTSVEINDCGQSLKGSLKMMALKHVKTLKEISLEDFMQVDDEKLEFIKSLPNLEGLRFVNMPIKDLNALNQINDDITIMINKLEVADYSYLSHPNIINEVITHNPLNIVGKVSREEMMIDINTNLVIPKDARNLSIEVSDGYPQDYYEIIDSFLHFRFSLFKELSNLKCSVSYTLKSEIRVVYPLINISVENHKKIDDKLE